MSDMICRKSMTNCQTPGMCAPHSGCREPAFNPDWNRLEAAQESLREHMQIIAGLKAENERLERKNANQGETIKQYQDQVSGGDLSLGMLIAERDKLKHENAGLMTGYEAYEQVVRGLRGEVEAFRSVMAVVVSEIPRGGDRKGNAPGHCHDIPGVWDRDNGDKAGKECGWCKVWNAAVAMSKGEPVQSKELVWCKCGDGYAANSYGAGFMDANKGVCENCQSVVDIFVDEMLADGKGEQS